MGSPTASFPWNGYSCSHFVQASLPQFILHGTVAAEDSLEASVGPECSSQNSDWSLQSKPSSIDAQIRDWDQFKVHNLQSPNWPWTMRTEGPPAPVLSMPSFWALPVKPSQSTNSSEAEACVYLWGLFGGGTWTLELSPSAGQTGTLTPCFYTTYRTVLFKWVFTVDALSFHSFKVGFIHQPSIHFYLLLYYHFYLLLIIY